MVHSETGLSLIGLGLTDILGLEEFGFEATVFHSTLKINDRQTMDKSISFEGIINITRTSKF